MSTPPESLAQRLEAALQRGAPELGVEHIESVERLTSGLSSHSYRVTARTADGPALWVMRVEPKHGTITPYDIAREFHLLRAVGDAGLPVPRALYLEEDEAVAGGRFLLMSFIEGEIFSSSDPRLMSDDALRERVQEQFVEALAGVHAVEQSVLPRHTDGREATRAEIAVCRARLARNELIPCPVFRHALDVLHERAPEPQRLALLHGDFRLPNLMFHGGRLSGILDWELARVGDPLSDLAFTCTIGAGVCSVDGPLAKHYSALTGIEVDENKMIYYRLLEMTKASIIGLAGAADMARGGVDLRLLSVATVSLAGQASLRHLEAQLDALSEAPR